MPWVRIDENAMEHRKILVLSAEAFQLWVRGLAHCQKHLTDGLITDIDLKTIRGVTKRRIEELTRPVGPGESPLWEALPNAYIVHDYLEWNDSRAHVLRARALAKERVQKLRSRPRNGVTVPEHREEQLQDVTRTRLRGVVCSEEILREEKIPIAPVDPARVTSAIASAKLTVEHVQARRAGDFIERYKALHVRLRRGAHYVGKPVFDFQEAMQLTAVYDDGRLDKLAFVWLNTDHDFAQNGTRTLAKFRSMVSWCEEQLINWEQKHGPLEVAS